MKLRSPKINFEGSISTEIDSSNNHKENVKIDLSNKKKGINQMIKKENSNIYTNLLNLLNKTNVKDDTKKDKRLLNKKRSKHISSDKIYKKSTEPVKSQSQTQNNLIKTNPILEDIKNEISDKKTTITTNEKITPYEIYEKLNVLCEEYTYDKVLEYIIKRNTDQKDIPASFKEINSSINDMELSDLVLITSRLNNKYFGIDYKKAPKNSELNQETNEKSCSEKVLESIPIYEVTDSPIKAKEKAKVDNKETNVKKKSMKNINKSNSYLDCFLVKDKNGIYKFRNRNRSSITKIHFYCTCHPICRARIHYDTLTKKYDMVNEHSKHPVFQESRLKKYKILEGLKWNKIIIKVENEKQYIELVESN